MTDQDPFSFAGSRDLPEAGDAAIFDLYREWQRQQEIADRADLSDDAAPAIARTCEIERQIFGTPCGPVGDAIKIYLMAQNEIISGVGGKLYPPCERFGYDDEGNLNLTYSAFRGLLSDAVRRVPELMPLVTDVITAPLTLAGEDEAEASAGAAAAQELSANEAAFLENWRRLDGTDRADLWRVLRLPPDDRSAVLRLLDRAPSAASLDRDHAEVPGSALGGTAT